MEHDDFIEQYVEICKRMYDRMERENSWPWVVDPEGWEEFQKMTGSEGGK
ncbi:MAG: hypothetical protein KA312_01600 [Sphingorhabdus sp.]|nr:hypothetical protein [Sphingorhabdus sp.]